MKISTRLIKARASSTNCTMGNLATQHTYIQSMLNLPRFISFLLYKSLIGYTRLRKTKISLTLPLVIEVPVQVKVSILPLHTIFLLCFGTVPTVWYFLFFILFVSGLRLYTNWIYIFLCSQCYHKKTTTCAGPGLGQAQKSDRLCQLMVSQRYPS